MFDIPIAVSRHTKNTAFATKGMKAKKGGVEKRNSWLSFVVSSVSLSLSHWYPGSGVVLDCIDS